MASKNHKRYKKRKHINTIKNYPKPRFDTPATLIEDWEGLRGLENDKYKIVIDKYSGEVVPKFEVPDGEWFDYYHYLSTHTFYDKTYFQTTEMLREMGFNIQLENWDGETRYSR